MTEHFDVLVIGAGLSGICAAYYLQTKASSRRFAVLEARDNIGGTWDLFRYPGIRSDSDMYTLGYSFHPWKSPKSIADGDTILEYLQDTVETYGLGKHLRFGQRVTRASWSDEDAQWRVEIAQADGTTREMTCAFLWGCTGYYDYDEGHTPDFPGIEDFDGDIVHPQHWTQEVEYEDRRVVVIGSGATAVTLVPELAKRASHVTMLQRSPTYIFSTPAQDHIADRLRAWLPESTAHEAVRWKNILVSMGLYQHARRFPGHARAFYTNHVRDALEGQVPVEPHFTPNYEPWDQRLCLVPDGDLFRSLRTGEASIVTDRIERIVGRGLELESGDLLEADLIVTATGLKIQVAGGAQIVVNGEPVRTKETMMYKGAMLSDVPKHGVVGRVHQRVVDAQMRTHQRVRHAAAAADGAARI